MTADTKRARNREYRANNRPYLLRREKQRREKRKAIPAPRNGDKWSAAEDSIVLSDDLTTVEMCYILGRSHAAVVARRFTLTTGHVRKAQIRKTRRNVERRCVECGLVFVREQQPGIQNPICSDQCRRIRNRRRYHEKHPQEIRWKCVECNAMFVGSPTRGANGAICSDDCRRARWNKKHRKRFPYQFPPNTITPRQAAEMAGVSRSTVFHHRKIGRLPAVPLQRSNGKYPDGVKFVFNVADVQRWMATLGPQAGGKLDMWSDDELKALLQLRRTCTMEEIAVHLQRPVGAIRGQWQRRTRWNLPNEIACGTLQPKNLDRGKSQMEGEM